jgi:hypothetical protein
MDAKPTNNEETKKTWSTPELTVHGDAAKITKESPTSAMGKS